MRNATFSLLLGAVVLVGGVDSNSDQTRNEGTGSVTGRVVFEGSAGSASLLKGTVVYLRGEGLTAVGAGDQALLDQRDISFTPRVVPLVVNSKVEIRNSDAITHNVHTKSRANRPFNKSQLAGMSYTASFIKPEVITVSCDIHSQMSAFIVVVPNRFFTTAAADGSYSIAGVPPGKYELVGWNEKYGTMTTTVDVVEGRATTAAVKFAS